MKPHFDTLLLPDIIQSNNDKQTGAHNTLKSPFESSQTWESRNLLLAKHVWDRHTPYINSIHFPCFQTCHLPNTLGYHKCNYQIAPRGIHDFSTCWFNFSPLRLNLSRLIFPPIFQKWNQMTHTRLQCFHCTSLLVIFLGCLQSPGKNDKVWSECQIYFSLIPSVTTTKSLSTSFIWELTFISKKKCLLVYLFVAATAVLSNLKRIEVTYPTHHSRRPSLWSSAAPQCLVLTCANYRQTAPQKSIFSSHRRTCHQSLLKFTAVVNS